MTMDAQTDLQQSYSNYYDKENYREVMSTIIQKQMDLIGFKLAITKARYVEDISINDRGRVMNYFGDPEEIIKKLLDQYKDLTGEAAYFFSKKAITQAIQINKHIKMPKALESYTPTAQFSHDISGINS